jgi:hypothetical protein
MMMLQSGAGAAIGEALYKVGVAGRPAARQDSAVTI